MQERTPSADAVRRARREDGAAVGRLWLAFLEEQGGLDERFRPADDALERWQNDFPSWLLNDGYRVFVAEEAGRVVGFVTAQHWYAPPIYAAGVEVHVSELFVEPAARGRGLGAALVAAVRTWAASVPATQIRLSMLVENAAGQRFWEKQGARAFAVIHTLPLEADDQETAPRRAKKLGF